MSFIVSAAKFTDKWGFGTYCKIIGALKKPKKIDNDEIKKILIIKLWALGDSILMLPMISALREKFPEAEIDILCSSRNRSVFEGQKFKKYNIIDVKDTLTDFFLWYYYLAFSGKRKYDLCIDGEPFLNDSAFNATFIARRTMGFSQGDRGKCYDVKVKFNKKRHMVQNYLDFARKLGIKCDTDKLLPLIISDKDKGVVSDFLKEEKITNEDFLVGISAGVAESVKFRMWPIEKFAQLSDELVKNHAKIIFIDSKNNKPIVDEIQTNMAEKSINAAGLFNVKQSAELIRKCKLVISNDSGMMHVAAAMGTPTIGLFGPNTPVLWRPYGKNRLGIDNISIRKTKIKPFIDNTNPDLIPKDLKPEQMTCMDAITVNDVMHAVEKLRRI